MTRNLPLREIKARRTKSVSPRLSEVQRAQHVFDAASASAMKVIGNAALELTKLGSTNILLQNGLDYVCHYEHTLGVTESIGRYTAIFRALSVPSRVRVLALLLSVGKDLCVCELVDSLEEPQYRISKSLRALFKLELISERRDGKWTYYRVAKADDAWLAAIHQAVMAIPREILKRDQLELARRFRLRVDGKCLLGVQKAELLSRPRKSSARLQRVPKLFTSTTRPRK